MSGRPYLSAEGKRWFYAWRFGGGAAPGHKRLAKRMVRRIADSHPPPGRWDSTVIGLDTGGNHVLRVERDDEGMGYPIEGGGLITHAEHHLHQLEGTARR